MFSCFTTRYYSNWPAVLLYLADSSDVITGLRFAVLCNKK